MRLSFRDQTASLKILVLFYYLFLALMDAGKSNEKVRAALLKSSHLEQIIKLDHQHI